MKWLKDDSYNAMKQAADNWDKLLNKVLGDNPDMKAEDVTVDQLLDSIESTGIPPTYRSNYRPPKKS